MASQTPQPAYVDALNGIVRDGVATAQQMASAADCSTQHMHNVLSSCSRKGLSLEAFQRLSAWLVDEKGEVRQLDAFLGVDGGAYIRPEQAEIDRCLLQEMAEMQKLMTYADDALKDGEHDAARRHIAKVKGLSKLAMEEVEAVSEMHDSRSDGHIHMDQPSR